MSDAGFEKVAAEGDLADETLISVTLSDGSEICLARTEGSVFAFEDQCSHASYPLSEGSLSGGYEIECVLHGATFDLRDGSPTGPPAESCLRMYDVKVEGGAILVRSAGG